MDRIAEELVAYRFPRWNELPSFDIYMDQVLHILNNILAPLYFHQEEAVVTASMVNNYVKNSLLKPPVKKHYNHTHVAFLIVVCVLKRCFSLKEISVLIDIHAHMEGSSLEMAYNRFADYFELYLHAIFKDGNIDAVKLPQDILYEQQLLANVVESVVTKMYAQYCIETAIQNGQK